MSPPSRTGVWSPVERLADLEVTAARPAGVQPRVDIIDRRLWTELASLPPAEAAELSALLLASARQAGWVDPAPQTPASDAEPPQAPAGRCPCVGA